MIKAGQVTGARALQSIKQNSDYLLGKVPRIWSEEFLSELNTTLLNQMDVSAAIEATSQMQLELDDLYALLRDLSYARRSRRWLYTRAYQGKQLRNYELWSAFVKENRTSDLQGNFLDVDPASLNGAYNDLLELPENSTKLEEVQKTLTKTTT